MKDIRATGFVHPFVGTDAAHHLREMAAARGDRPFLIWAPFEGPAVTWSWARFADDVARVAGGLAARGIGPRDRVLVHLENCPETLIARFACVWIGAIAVLSNAGLTAPELRDVAAASNVKAAITQPKFLASVSSCAGLSFIAVTETDAGEAPASPVAKSQSFATLHSEALPPRAPDPAAPALILFTTGTTSRAKGVVWTNANILWGGRMAAIQQGVRDDDVYHVFLPLFHVVGFSWSFLAAFYCGGAVLLQPRFSASRFWPAALAHRATISSQVKFTANVLSQTPAPAHHFRQWTTANHTPASARHFGVREVSGWGMTEMVAQGIVGDPWTQQPARTVGRPSHGYEIFVEDDDANPVQPGETGHLKVSGVRGLSIFLEYDGQPDVTAAAFDARGRFLTGDRVILLDNGWIEFGDRVKDVIKVGGEGVSGGEIESCIAQVAGVREVAVVGKPDETWGESPAAFVILKDGAPDAATMQSRILDHCRASLAKFKVPRDIIIVADMPRIGFGKIAKVKLREELIASTKASAPL